MIIDDNIEEHLREAYRGVMAKDLDRMVRAFSGLDRAEADQVLRYAIMVVALIVNEVYPDPGRPECDILAGEIVAEEDWAEVSDPIEVAQFLFAAATGDSAFLGVTPSRIPVLAVACGGHLLLHYSDEGQEWWSYLDQIWKNVESS